MAASRINMFVLAGIAFMLMGAALRIYGIATQPPLIDEIGVAFTAVNYMESGQFGPTMWFHPHLRDILQYWVGGVFGHGPYALRGISLLTGILTVPLAGIILYELTKNRTASLLAAFLLAVEQVHITFSRQAIQETWTTFLFMLGVLCFVYFVRREKPLLLLVCGAVFGLGIASKFHALFPLAVCLGAGLYLAWEKRSPAKAGFVFSCLVLVPAAVYLLTFIPWFGRGYGLADWFAMQKAIFTAMTIHQGNPADQLIDKAAWQWFLRPMGYAAFVFQGGKPHVTVAYSNPFVWFLVLPSFVSVTWHQVRKKSLNEEGRGVIFLLLLFAASYMPLAASPRPIWLLSSLATIPFAFMIVASAVSHWIDGVKWRQRVVAGYLLLIFAASIALYPLAIGKGKEYGYLHFIVQQFRPAFENGTN